ncbi:MAG: PfkB family carbohydrate kinase [Promethearchaeota archaeon]
MVIKSNKVIVIGPLAIDYILQFDGKFTDYVLNDFKKGKYKCNIITKNQSKYFGGTAGNISYNLGQLNVGEIDLISSVGKDFESSGYKAHINRFKNIKLGVNIHRDSLTATCYIVNDIKSNQMIIFYEGAMDKFKIIDLKVKIDDSQNYIYAINSTHSVDSMIKITDQLYNLKIPMIFDPGQKIPLFSKKSLLGIIKKSNILIGNKYEINQIKGKINMTDQELIKFLKAIIITEGADGSKLIYKDYKNKIYRYNIPVSKTRAEILDTTGSGDAYRAGFLAGLILKMSLLESCYLGSVLATFVIETFGPQTHTFKLIDVKKKYLSTFGYIPQVLGEIIES